ncbi:polyprenyl synthetase family protein [Agrococcus versicolor]|uniref:polyprenyl synthetase family protein n=1 Tax=Agrococcus versicolor TaxID=501482 RepID=UPI0031E2A2FC
MSPGSRFSKAVDARIGAFLSARRAAATAISPDLAPVLDAVDALTTGGKRMRAGFLHWGWHAVAAARPGAPRTTGSPEDPEWEAVVSMASAVEIFHAAALAHDDVMDSSDTRRGAPSVHRRLEGVHRASEWRGRAESFGVNGAILVGDLLLGWADDLARAGAGALGPERGPAAMAVFSTMREEVGLGQFLDVLEEAAWVRQDPASLLQRAHTVAVYKSARYSVEAPLLIGATMAGASETQLEALSGYGVPVGTAFQMRDDILGVFGDPVVTGKPAGDDLREGKRTVLVELARRQLSPGVRSMLDELLGDPGLDAVQIATLQRTIADAGALEQLETMIDRAVGGALEALRDAELSRGAVLELERLAAAAARRDS